MPLLQGDENLSPLLKGHLLLQDPSLPQVIQKLGVKPLSLLPGDKALQPPGQKGWVRPRVEAHPVP